MINVKMFFRLLNIASLIFFRWFEFEGTRLILVGPSLSNEGFLHVIILDVELTLHQVLHVVRVLFKSI